MALIAAGASVKVLIAEDDLDLLELMAYALRRQGYTVVTATDGRQALQCWEAERPDIVLLDGTLPTLDGFEVCRRIRGAGRTPIIMLLEGAQEAVETQALDLGADDNVTKPFSIKRLRVRMRAILRRDQPDAYPPDPPPLHVGDLTLDLESHEVTKAGRPVQLAPLEFKILYMLAMNPGRVIPYSRMVDYGDIDGVSLLPAHVARIRAKLGMTGDQPGDIRDVPGVGCILTRAEQA